MKIGPIEISHLNPFVHPDGLKFLDCLYGENIFGAIFILVAMTFVNPWMWVDFYLEENRKGNGGFFNNIGLFLHFIISIVMFFAVFGGLIYFIWWLYTSSRSCGDGHEKYIVQRDIIDFLHPEYSIYKEKAPLTNLDSAKYPPAVRIDIEFDSLRDVFIPNFSFGEPKYFETYEKEKFIPLNFTQIFDTFSSLFFPSYIAKNSNGEEIAKIFYPSFKDEGADLVGTLGFEKKYIIQYKGSNYITSEEIEQIFEGEFVKKLNFYDPEIGDEDDPIGEIKHRANALGREGLYTICLKIDIDPVLKELLFATVIAYDQHIIREAQNKNN